MARGVSALNKFRKSCLYFRHANFFGMWIGRGLGGNSCPTEAKVSDEENG